MKKGLVIGACFLIIFESGIYSYPQDLDTPSNNIFHYTDWGENYQYARGYCSIVRGCAGYKDVTTEVDGSYVCRCDTGSFGCEGESCITSSGSYVTITSVTCVECDEDTDCGEGSTCQNYVCVGGAAPVCGDGNLDTGEECDDGNTVNDDGCSSGCVIETGWGCTGEPSICTEAETPQTCMECVESGGAWCDMLVEENDYCDLESICLGAENVITTPVDCSTIECVPACVYPFVCVGGECAQQAGIPTNETGCVESDDGIDYFTQGTTSNLTHSETDKCTTGSDIANMMEYSCENGEVKSYPHKCLNGCVDGACVGEPTTTECTDSDGHLSLEEQYYVPGTTSLGNFSSEDICDGEEIVQEFYCFEDGINDAYYKCPNGCDNGACIEIPIGGECTTGCYLDEKCYNIGVRKSGDYCGEDLDFEKQKEADALCGDNFECLSNICIDGACVKASLWKQFLAFIRGEISWSDIFGGGDKPNLVADDLVYTIETESAYLLLDYREINLDETDEYSTEFFVDIGNGFDRMIDYPRVSLSSLGLKFYLSGPESSLYKTSFKVRVIMDTKEEIKESSEKDNCIQKSFTAVIGDDGNITGFDSGEVESCVREEEPITTECTDSDGGVEREQYYVKGTITNLHPDIFPNLENRTYIDICMKDNYGYVNDTTENYLFEGYCGEDGYGHFLSGENKVYCPNGCEDGACVLDVVVNSTCSDDDGGVEGEQYNVKGIASDEVNSFEDICIVAQSYEYDDSGAIMMGEYSSVVDCTGLNCFLFEAVCKDSGIAGGMYYICPDGCKEGKCVLKKPISKPLIVPIAVD